MSKKFLKVFFSMSLLLIIGKLMGFAKSMLIAYHYGAGYISDVISFEDSLINELYSVFATFLGCTFIPTYLSENENTRTELTNKLLSAGIFFISVIILAAELFAPQLLKILVPGFFDIYDISQMVIITRINLINLFGIFLINYLATLLQANKIYIFLALEGVISSLFIILYLCFLWQYEIWGIVVTRIISSAVIVGILLTAVRTTKIHSFKMYTRINDDRIKGMVKTAFPLLIVSVLYQMNYIVDKSMASGFMSGSVASLNYANLLATALYGVVGYIISTYAYPMMAEKSEDSKKVFNKYYYLLCGFVIPIAVAMCFFSKDIVAIVFGRGQITSENIQVISLLLICYLPGIIAYCIKNYLVKMFYVQKDTRVLVFIDSAGVLVNIGLNFILAKFLGVYGLAIATSISYYISMILQFIILTKREYIVATKGINIRIMIMLIPTVLLSMLMSFVAVSYIESQALRLVIFMFTTCIGLIIFNIESIRTLVVASAKR